MRGFSKERIYEVNSRANPKIHGWIFGSTATTGVEGFQLHTSCVQLPPRLHSLPPASVPAHPPLWSALITGFDSKTANKTPL